MAAITWRNVSGPTGAAELNALAGASRQIGGAFDGLQNALVNYQKEEGRQFDQRKTDNTNAFLNALHSQYRTPEELDAAMKSGAINQLQQQYSGEINHEQVRGAAEQRLTDLRQNTTAANQYDDQLRDRADSELVQKAMAHLAGGGKATDVLPSLQGTRKYGDYAKMLQDAERGNIRFEWDGENHKWGVREKQANINQSNAAANASRVSAANAADANRRANDLHGLNVQNQEIGLVQRQLEFGDLVTNRGTAQMLKDASNDENLRNYQYLDNINKQKDTLMSLAGDMNLPRLSNGDLNYLALTDTQKEELSKRGAISGINMKSLYEEDTFRAQARLKELEAAVASGLMTPQEADARKKLMERNSLGIVETGNTAAITEAESKAKEADRASLSQFSLPPASQESSAAFDKAIENALAGEEKRTFWGLDKYDATKGAYSAIQNEGIKVKVDTPNGKKTIRVLPNPADLQNMLKGMEADFTVSDFAQPKALLRKWADRPENIRAAEEWAKSLTTKEIEDYAENLKKSQTKGSK